MRKRLNMSVLKRTRTRTILITVIALSLTVALPIAAQSAVDRFDDVPDTSIFYDDIEWMAATGVTLGCNPPSANVFCPKNVTTREQMAAFFHRYHEWQITQPGYGGADGADGADGEDGATGPQGADGANGADGEDGATGADGANGADGEDGATGPQGADGADGATGPQGADGEDGATGVLGFYANSSAAVNIPKKEHVTVTATCDSGDTVVGGGWTVSPYGDHVIISESAPSGNDSWTVTGYNRKLDVMTFTVHARCADLN